MKNLLLIISLFFGFFQYVTAQDNKVVSIVIESINTKSTEKLNPYLATDFTIAGQKGELAKVVLKQLFSQLNETVVSYKQLPVTESNKLIKKYDIEYTNMGIKEATFIFNNEGKLKELMLFPMEVKTMENDTKIEKNKSAFIEIPFKMAGKLIAVEVMLNGEKRNFIVDSGAPKVIINSKYFTKKDDKKKLSSAKGVSGNISGMDIETIEQFDFYGIKFSNQEVVSMNLEHLEKSLNTDIYGLIGYEMLKEYDILFDYENKKMTLINPQNYEEYKEEYLKNLSFDKINFTQEKHIPIIDLEVGNQKFKCGIDCGAEGNLLQDSLFLTLENEMQNLRKDELIGAENEAKQVNKAELKQVTIGNTEFENVKTLFSDLSHLNEGYKLSLDGLIGYEILSKQKTLISFKRKELIFITNVN